MLFPNLLIFELMFQSVICKFFMSVLCLWKVFQNRPPDRVKKNNNSDPKNKKNPYNIKLNSFRPWHGYK